MKIGAIIVAAGRGTRAGGGLPKQYRDLLGKPVVAHSVERFRALASISDIVVVVHPDDRALAAAACPGARLTDGGETRASSVAAGLAALPTGTTHVLIHDAARPCVSQALIGRVIDGLSNSPGVAPALPVTDTLWRAEGEKAVAIQSRDGIARAQTPQGFELGSILRAHASAPLDATDDVAVALAAGIDVAIVRGDEQNLKITGAQDFARAAQILEPALDIRTGIGFDVHKFTKGDGVILCGVKIPHNAALLGHSDADVAMHAITDAIYGALAMGDIGRHFPPSEPKWKGEPSDTFLRHACGLATSSGFRTTNIDCTIICEQPKIGPHADAMVARLSEITGTGISRISVKATTTETLGFTGRGEGIAAQAAVTLVSQ